MTRAGLVDAAKAAGAIAVVDAPSREAKQAWTDVLAEIPLFAHVSQRHLRKIAAFGVIVRFQPGTAIVRAGQQGDAFYVVLDGRASVVRGRGLADVRLGAGDSFGEMALIDGRPRSATVAAVTEVTCLRLGRNAFQKILRNEPSVSLALLQSLAERIRSLQSTPTA